jgi:hypothetical protein
MKELLLALTVLSSFVAYSQSVLTRGEVWDFEIGDEFHYSFNNYPGTMVERNTIIDKHFSQNNDTIFYTQSESNYSNGPDGNGGTAHYYSYDTTSYYITNVNYPISQFGGSFEIYDEYLDSTYFYFPDTIIDYDVNLCNLEINGFDSYPPVFESNHILRLSGRGVGTVWTYHYDPSSPFPYLEDRKLYYYKKGNFTCGTLNTVSIDLNEMPNTEIKVYPLPANQQVNIDFGALELVLDFQLIDLNGKLIPIDINKDFNTIYSFSSKDIPNGIYFIHASTKNTSFKRKVIITH